MTFLQPTLPSDEARTPCLDDRGRAAVRALREHPDAPRWTYALGDRLERSDLDHVEGVRERLGRALGATATPNARLLAALASRTPHTDALRTQLGGLDLLDDFEAIPRTRRADLAAAPWRFVPEDADLERMVVYRTAGTTGHPVVVPHHPRAVAHYLPLVESALARWQVPFAPQPGQTAAFLLSAQLRTYTYATALSAWGGAGFAKLNLRATDWRDPGAPRRYLEAFDPPLLHGEPLTFAELLRSDADLHPRWILSTSVALSPALRAALADRFGAVVVDWYASVATGPLAVSAPDGIGLALLADDVHVEVVGADDRPLPILDAGAIDAVPEPERGAILVSSARNPYLPLLRYDTGDRGRLLRAPDGSLRLWGLEGRAALRFRAGDGTLVGTVDISRALREHPVGPKLLAHRFEQDAAGRCALTLRALPGSTLTQADIDEVHDALHALLVGAPLTIGNDDALFDDDLRAGRKPVPYRADDGSVSAT